MCMDPAKVEKKVVKRDTSYEEDDIDPDNKENYGEFWHNYNIAKREANKDVETEEEILLRSFGSNLG